MRDESAGNVLGGVLLARCAVAIAGVLLFYLQLDGYIYVAYSGPGVSIWIGAFTVAALAFVLLDQRSPLLLLRSPLGWWIAFYFLLTTAWAVFMPSDRMPLLYERYKAIAFLLAFALLFEDGRVRRVGELAVAGAVVLATALNVAEALGVMTFVQQQVAEDGEVATLLGRSAGTYFSANASGQAIALGLAVAVPAVPRSLRIPLVLVAAVGVLLTFSRAAALCLAIVFVGLTLRRSIGLPALAAGVAGAALVALDALQYIASHDVLDSNTSSRLFLTKDDSGRGYLARKAWELFRRAPLLGHNLGATSLGWDEGQGAHNIYLTLAAEHGVLGLLAFPALGVALLASSRGAAVFVVALMVLGVFSHNLLIDRYVLLCVVLSASAPLATREGASLREAVAVAS